MEVKPGFKQTGAGVFPEDWEEQHLSSLVTTGPKNGYSGRSSKGARGTPTLSLGATTSGALVLNDDTVKRLEETIDPNSELFLQSGDVLVQRSNTLDLVGTTAVFEGPSGVYVYPDLMMRIRFRENATAHWFWRYANSPSGRRFFMAVAAGSSGSMPKISGDRLRQMLVPVPPFFEQRAIATALNDVDALLGGLERLIAKKRDLKQAAMQQLLTGQTRLPGFSESWVTVQLGDISHIKTGGRNHEDKEDGGRFPFFVRSERVERIDSFSYDCEAIIVPGEGNIGSVLHYVSGRFDLHQRVYKVSDFPECIHGKFIYLAMAYGFGRHAMRNTVKATVDSLRLPTFLSFELVVPSTICEQHAIATVLSDMDAEIAALEARRAKTRDLKQAMMQELLTGRTRLVQREVTHA